ncbi:MAG: VanZ family protein [Marinobacter sp.]|nr:VanZ family protein [Marinobacter sp.]
MARIRHTIVILLRRRRLWQAALTVSIIAILYIATADNSYPIPTSDNDKISHLLAFIELTVLARLSWPRLRAIWCLPALVGFGLALEAMQANLPYRVFSLTDMLANFAGIAIGLLIWGALQTLMNQRVKDSPESL